MKKIISMLLTIAMLASMCTFIASAADNPALFYQGANLAPDSYFQSSYCFTSNGDDTNSPYLQRDKATGEFDLTWVFDIKFTDYGSNDSHMIGFDMTPDMHGYMNYHFGYSYTEKAFVVYRAYMPGGDITSEYQLFAKMSYDMPLNEWHEFALRATEGKIFQMYLDGVLMLEVDFDDIHAVDTSNAAYDWDWCFANRNSDMNKDRWWLTILDSDLYIDNMSVYSGDYNFGTGTATTTHCTETEFANLMEGAESTGFGPFSCSQGETAPFFYSANGGTDKVTYDRDFAANHTHSWTHDTENSKTAHCLNPGYDLYVCSCGASEQRNYVETLGHLPGFLISTDLQGSENATGVETRRCNRAGCMKNYQTIVNLTNTTDKALHMYTKGGSNMYNGYMAVPNSMLMVQDDGVTIVADIMPISQIMKSHTAIGATMGGCDDNYFVGYDYNLAKFVIKNGDEVIAESDKTLNNYEWAEWMWHRDGYTVSLYIDGEMILTAELGEFTYDLDGEDGLSDNEISDTHFFLFKAPACEILIDNVIVADPDYDAATRTGIIYDHVTFNNNDYNIPDGYLNGPNKAIQFLMYTKAAGEGYQVEAHGLPTEDVVRIHRDMAMKIDSNYENGSKNGYSQLYAEDGGDDAFNLNNEFAAGDQSKEGIDLEMTFDFYAYDWCTDETLLNTVTETTDEAGNVISTTTTKGSAFIGAHINGNCNNNEGNGFIGYDFIKQQAVIGSVGNQSKGEYGANNVYADYAVAKNTWHTYTIKYDYDTTNKLYVMSILIDGKEVLSQTTDYITVEYMIFFPNFVKGYLDNLTVKVNGITYDDNVDFTNGYGVVTSGMDFSGTDWSLAPGGVPTHVYETQIFPASCETDGYTIYTCSCGDSTYTAYDQIAQGHTWGEGVVTTPATETTEGVMTYTCGACGDTKTEAIPKVEPEFTYGDVNGDGSMKSADLSALRRFVGGASSVSIVAEASDVNADGSLKSNDVSTLGRKLGGANIVLGPAA